METILDASQKHALKRILDRGAETATRSLTQWIGQPVRVAVSEVDEVSLDDTAELLGPSDDLVAACVLGLTGRLTGVIVLVFEDRSGLALADLLLNQPVGTANAWGELERSAAQETANIVVCAYLGSLAESLKFASGQETAELVPSPPMFRHEFAGSLMEFLVMEQAMEMDRMIVIKSQFATDQGALRWSLVFAPDGPSLQSLAASLSNL